MLLKSAIQIYHNFIPISIFLKHMESYPYAVPADVKNYNISIIFLYVISDNFQEQVENKKYIYKKRIC